MKREEKKFGNITSEVITMGIIFIIITSSFSLTFITNKGKVTEVTQSLKNDEYPSHPCNIRSISTAIGTWVTFDSSAIGTPAEVHVTISDTSGITVVADFHGFWRNNYTINETVYDDLDMPGATPIRGVGTPMLPCIYEYLEVPHNVDVSIDILSFSKGTTSGYDIRPNSPVSYPVITGDILDNSSLPTTEFFSLSSVYTANASYPGVLTSTEGYSNASTMVMRGHRLLGLTFYPVQYNPVMSELEVYSQLIIKVKYSFPAQIISVPIQLQSEAFDNILSNIVLNPYLSNLGSTPDSGIATVYPPPAPDAPKGAEYLIITNATFRNQAQRLANWKQQKGLLSEVIIVEEEDPTVDDVKAVLEEVYSTWNPVPTYVLIFGDVEVIPANYDYQHRGQFAVVEEILGFEVVKYYDFFSGAYAQGHGKIASDLGYFNLDGHGYIPDVIYSRISVDTEEQAQTIVNKILQYEIAPSLESIFYDSTLFAGYFQDAEKNEIEDSTFSFLYTLERIRYYMKNTYDVYTNYSCAWQHYASEGFDSPFTEGVYLDNLRFSQAIPENDFLYIRDSVVDIENFGWIMSYYTPAYHRDYARVNVTLNINQGRFLVLYLGHGGSKNMVYPRDVGTPNNRENVEGWLSPYYNTSFFSDLANNNMTPLFINLACNTGWYDGETDEDTLYVDTPEGNAYAKYANECFAENLTRLEHGGAIAVIAASRPATAFMMRGMAYALVQSFWPGFLNSQNQPMYGMATALQYSKLYAKSQWTPALACALSDYSLECRINRMTFEEFHLFGDPETELWTGIPEYLDVSYPISVGTTNPQKFVVTVKNLDNGEPVHFAKVCVQQQDYIYQVGYTNTRGQVIFDIDPVSSPSHINVTVTKHNYRPHIGYMFVQDSNAQVSLSTDIGMENEEITLTFSNYPSYSHILIDFDGDIEILPLGVTEYTTTIPSGPNGFMNLWVAIANDMIPSYMWGYVSVQRIARISEAEGPDPYIYTMYDVTTWPDPNGEFVWDNPDIIIKRNGVVVSSMNQNVAHEIEVTVHNRGCESTKLTTVTLSYAPFGGGVSWSEVGVDTINPRPGIPDIAKFTIYPPIPHSACLMVVIDHDDELPENTINNIGLENIDVIEMSSPGEGVFMIGNPTTVDDYVFVNVRQQGNYEDVWNATIQEYSSQIMKTKTNETIVLIADPMSDITNGEERIFTIEVYVNGNLVGGMVFNTSSSQAHHLIDWERIKWLIVGACVAVIAVVVYVKRDKIWK